MSELTNATDQNNARCFQFHRLYYCSTKKSAVKKSQHAGPRMNRCQFSSYLVGNTRETDFTLKTLSECFMEV